MKHLKEIMILTLSVVAAALAVATCNLVSLYEHEKEQTMVAVRECAENAVLLEMIGRMESGEDKKDSYIRLNAIMGIAQQKDGRIARSDTLRTSLAALLQCGLEFKDNRWEPDFRMLDSIFMAELNRNGLRPDEALIEEGDSELLTGRKLWGTTYSICPSSIADYHVFVSPMRMNVLARLWGIIIPFLVLVSAFSFLAIYFTRTFKRMRTLEQMKDDFTHNMTHELKTPVAVAYSAADSMLRYYDQSDETRNRQFLKIIMQRLGFLSGMIENILSMSMERFKTMKLNIESATVKPIVEEISGMIKLKAAKPVEIDIDIPENLTIHADTLHFGNIISNLMDNAVKYSGESVRIRIKTDSRTLTISDNGIGIDKDYLPFIFDKFYRVTSGNCYETGGYGLGLFYVRQITELMGWSIEVTSKMGYGTKFTIRFNDDEEG